MNKIIREVENDLAKKFQYIVWVGGCDDYYSNYKDAKRDADQWKAKGYNDVIIEKIQKGGAEAGFVAQLLFYPEAEQLFVLRSSRLANVWFWSCKKIKKDVDLCSNQYYIYIKSISAKGEKL